jgi:hypothetical protein
MIAHIGVKSGVIERRPVINGRGEIRPVKATHGLRKAFQTTAINAGMSPLYSEILMGQKELEFKSKKVKYCFRIQILLLL